RTVAGGGCAPVVVVSGAVPLDVPGAAVVHNPHWSSGMGSSLRVGLAALPDHVSAAVVLLVDLPWLGVEAVRRVIAAHREGWTLAVATYGGRRGHPVLLGRQHWYGIRGLAHGDIGAKAYLAKHPEDVIEVDCTGTGDPADADVPEALS